MTNPRDHTHNTHTHMALGRDADWAREACSIYDFEEVKHRPLEELDHHQGLLHCVYDLDHASPSVLRPCWTQTPPRSGAIRPVMLGVFLFEILAQTLTNKYNEDTDVCHGYHWRQNVKFSLTHVKDEIC